ncbi:hypothetical protein [Flavobacterium sp. 1]|nr:hypothetical protein [Flavobacterium sp. 1]
MKEEFINLSYDLGCSISSVAKSKFLLKWAEVKFIVNPTQVPHE